MQAETVKKLAQECGFELAGIAAAEPISGDFARYESWVHAGMAGKMGYLTDRRADLRRDPRNLLAGARSIICVGKLYNTQSRSPYHVESCPPGSDTPPAAEGRGIISRYARGRDYHDVMRAALEELAHKLLAIEAFEWRVCVDTAPILERSYARQAGLGWIGRNQCLINEPLGSWFFLGELLVSLDIAPDSPPPPRCGTCRRCIEACPTAAIVPSGIDATLCISYFTIELRAAVPPEHRAAIGPHVFGCDICQDVCPWNRRAPITADPAFEPREFAPPLEKLAALSESEFRDLFRGTAIKRARYTGFLRNVAVAMGNTRLAQFRAPLERLAASADAVVASHARWALTKLP